MSKCIIKASNTNQELKAYEIIEEKMRKANIQDPITQDSKVAIIGAGPAGLSSAKHLLGQGSYFMFYFVFFELLNLKSKRIPR